MQLADLKPGLSISEANYSDLPAHVAGFCSFLIKSDHVILPSLFRIDGESDDDATAYPRIACIGYAMAAGLVTDDDAQSFRLGFDHLSGRTFFAEGRVPRFEVDGFALLGVALGARATQIAEDQLAWFIQLLAKSAINVPQEEWEYGLVKAAQVVLEVESWNSVDDVLFRVAMQAALNQEFVADDRQRAWEKVVSLVGETASPKIAAGRAVYDSCVEALSRMPVHGAGFTELVSLLEALRDAMSHWTYETKPRVKGVLPQQWEIDHEYHVQNLLWTVLRPVFGDLVDEQSLPKVGHSTPRYDLGVPSLQTIIEVKFMRRAGTAECRKVTQEIAADRSLYLGDRTGYDKLVAFIWDDCRQTEEYATLQQGLENLEGIEKVIILPRPSRMERPAET
ncbi:MAG: hypothetical protein JJ920_08115 [Roseitalea sp.]|jgi:hypothetical protein|nr:hypothetical protein [Roseitalea sp.]MBO6721066.1 hypothetical protein [Roseitalea sp.]MBO6742862.1 hypothetical protein [Roseitalea sp.]